ncbi:MAG TPA: hypothetical protein VHX44_15915 [Planctomycetota bacterium]|nr:hypothetical protein [Planctomycetota bacterium]
MTTTLRTIALRQGSTMLELVIAFAVLAIALGVTLQGMVSVSSFAGLHSRQADLEEQCRRISRHLHDNLVNTAWFVGHNPLTDRTERLFPQVIRGDADGYGDELVFLRLRTERTAGLTPVDTRVDPVDFNHQPPVPMDRFARATGVRSLVLNPQWQPDNIESAFAIPTWESTAPTMAYRDARDLSKLRFYRLVVHPDVDVTGRGVLFREYRDGIDGLWISDERIADNLVSFTVATNREAPTLNANQVLISISLQADDLTSGQARARRTLQMVIAMRSGLTE